MFKKSSQNKKTPKTTDVTFKNTVCHVPWNVRTQEIDKSVFSWEEIEDCIFGIFADSDEFVTLTTGEDIPYHIRYVQATQCNEGIVVQVGIEEGEKTRLVEKVGSQKECMDILREFYNTLNVQDLEKYKPMEFFV